MAIGQLQQCMQERLYWQGCNGQIQCHFPTVYIQGWWNELKVWDEAILLSLSNPFINYSISELSPIIIIITITTHCTLNFFLSFWRIFKGCVDEFSNAWLYDLLTVWPLILSNFPYAMSRHRTMLLMKVWKMKQNFLVKPHLGVVREVCH